MVQNGSDGCAAYMTGERRWIAYLRRGASILTPMRKKEHADVRDAGTWHAKLYRDHETLKSEWRQLEKTGCCTPFQTYDWVSAWYEAVASNVGAEPLIVTVSRAQEPEVIFPLCLYRKGHLKIISFPDFGVSDYTGPVFAPGSVQTPQAARAMMAQVLSVLPACDLVQFLKLPERIDGESNPLFWLKGIALMPDEECFGVLLRQDWASQAEEIMDRPLLSTIRRRRGQIAKLGVVIYDRISDPLMLGKIWETLVGMRRERFLKLGREDLLGSPVWQRFYKSLLTRSDRTLDVSIARMTVSGETIASCFGITRGSTYYMLIPTFQMGQWERYVPGMQLFYEIMRTQAAAGGGYFDFTIGEETYKSRIGGRRRSLYEWRKPLSARGALWHGLWRGKVALRRHPKLLSLAQSIKTIVFG